MDIFFQDPDVVPLPPSEVRIKEIRVEPWPDGRRVRVYLELTPFQKRPDGDIIITNTQGEELANVSFIETINPMMEFTLHLHGAELIGPFTVNARVFYTNRFESGEQINLQPEVMLVDQAGANFNLPT